MAKEAYYPELDHGYHSQVRWGAIFAGVIIGIVTQILLSLLGLAVGLTVYDPISQPDMGGLGIGSSIWVIVSSIISVFVGGWTAASLANVPVGNLGTLHGILTWGLLLLVTFFLLGTGVGRLAGGAFNLLSMAGITMMQDETTETSAAQESDVDRIQGRLNEMMGQVTESLPGGERMANLDLPPDVQRQVAQHIAAGNDQEAANLISENSEMTPGEAQNMVQESKVETREVAQQVTDTASQVLWWTFFAVLLSLIAGAVGGRMGARNNRYIREV